MTPRATSNGGPRSVGHAKFAHRLRLQMARRGMTRAALAALLGVSPTMVGYWRLGRYLPTPEWATVLADELDDKTIATMVQTARTGRCPCGATFDREQTRRTYCSAACQRAAHGPGGVKPTDLRQVAIDAMCAGCEPEGLCRDDACALRPFSPYLFVSDRRVVGAA